MSSGLPRSIQTRLVRHAHALDQDPNLVLSRYATERLLYRLSRSEHADRFVLKGVLMAPQCYASSMKPRVKDLLNEALELAPEDRADLAGWLLDTLEPEDSGVERAWHVEIRKRIDELDSGAVEPMSAEEAESRIFRLRDAGSDA